MRSTMLSTLTLAATALVGAVAAAPASVVSHAVAEKRWATKAAPKVFLIS